MRPSLRRPIRLSLAAALAALAVLLFGGHGARTAHAAPSAPAPASVACEKPVAGTYIYDCADLLTPSEVLDLQRHAAAVERAGAPPIVYVRAHSATYDETLQDARNLMNAWDVESKPGAHDGFVMYVNLQPGNLRHGQIALFAGAKYYNGGALQQGELQRIYSDVMLPSLRDGATAQAIADGLDAVAHDLVYGPPAASRPPAAAIVFGRLPFNILALLLLAASILLYRRGKLRVPADPGGTTPELSYSLAPPGDLAPALAGALAVGRVSDAQMEATVLDFARRGLLKMEPVGQYVQLRLLNDGSDLRGFEREVWRALAKEAEDNLVPASSLPAVALGWGWPKQALRNELVDRGWYDAKVSERRVPLYLVGCLGFVGFFVGVIVVVIAQEGWALLGSIMCVAEAITAFTLGHAIPDTSVNGERLAAPWRAYRTRLKAGEHLADLDTALPYIVGLGLAGTLGARLLGSGAQGYSPDWFTWGSDHAARTAGFYPYWIAFHGAMYPPSTSGGTGGFSGGGGAAAGGGGAGGAF